jgi:hypothetical protein
MALKVKDLELYETYKCRLSDKLVQVMMFLGVEEYEAYTAMGDLERKAAKVYARARYFNTKTEMFEDLIVEDNQLETIDYDRNTNTATKE